MAGRLLWRLPTLFCGPRLRRRRNLRRGVTNRSNLSIGLYLLELCSAVFRIVLLYLALRLPVVHCEIIMNTNFGGGGEMSLSENATIVAEFHSKVNAACSAPSRRMSVGSAPSPEGHVRPSEHPPTSARESRTQGSSQRARLTGRLLGLGRRRSSSGRSARLLGGRAGSSFCRCSASFSLRHV